MKRGEFPPGFFVSLSYDEIADKLSEMYFKRESYGPDEDNPESGIMIEMRNSEVEITQWDLTEPPDDEDYMEDWERAPVLRVDSVWDIEKLFENKNVERRYTLKEFVQLPEPMFEDELVSMALSALAHYGGDESWVESVGD